MSGTNNGWHSYKGRRLSWNDMVKTYGRLKALSWLLNPHYQYAWTISPSWRLANDQYKFFKGSNLVSKVVTITPSTNLKNFAKNNNIRAGDLLYFDSSGNGNPTHAAMISKVDDNDIYYTAHTSSKFDYSLKSVYEKYKKIYVLVISK